MTQHKEVLPDIIAKNGVVVSQSAYLAEAVSETEAIIAGVGEVGMDETLARLLARTQALLIQNQVNDLEIGYAYYWIKKQKAHWSQSNTSFSEWLMEHVTLYADHILQCIRFYELFQTCVDTMLSAEALLKEPISSIKLSFLEKQVRQHKARLMTLETKVKDESQLVQAVQRQTKETEEQLSAIMNSTENQLRRTAAVAAAPPKEMPPLSIIWETQVSNGELVLKGHVPCNMLTLRQIRANRIHRTFLLEGERLSIEDLERVLHTKNILPESEGE